jgi:hypothetical protein
VALVERPGRSSLRSQEASRAILARP